MFKKLLQCQINPTDHLNLEIGPKYMPYRVENVRKGEIACYKQFCPLAQCFPQLHIFNASKCGIVW